MVLRARSVRVSKVRLFASTHTQEEGLSLFHFTGASGASAPSA